MERVKKGEKYWYIASDFFAGDFYIAHGVDFYEDIQDGRFALGNYFRTKAEAESMARKLRAVLKGADVIEQPSVEDEFNSIDRIYHQEGYAEGEHCHEQSFSWGFQEGVDWLKSKIIK